MKVKLYNGLEWSINPKLKQELDILLSDIKHDEMDTVIPITGPEGWGKSFTARGLAMYCATVLGTKFGVSNIEFELGSYIRNSLKAPKHTVLLLDESRQALGRSKIRNKKVENFLDYISECRSRQQVHIMCIPAYHDLKSYIVNWRCPMILHLVKNYVGSPDRPSGVKMKRGEVRVYTDKTQIKYYYDYPYKYPKQWQVRDWWSPVEVFSEDQLKEYIDKKDKFTYYKYGDEEKKEISKRALTDTRRRILPRIKKLFPDANQLALAEIFECNSSVISRDLKKGDVES